MQSRRRRDTVSTSDRKPNISARSKSVRKSLAVTKISFAKKILVRNEGLRGKCFMKIKFVDERGLTDWTRFAC